LSLWQRKEIQELLPVMNRSMGEEITPSSDFFTDVRRIRAETRAEAVRAVNSAMVEAYW
jgi:hypothetical protein